MQPYLAEMEKKKAETEVLKKRVADSVERTIEKLNAETAAIKKRIADKDKKNRDVEEETREIKRQMGIMRKDGCAPTTRKNGQRVRMRAASDAQDAYDEYDGSRDAIDAGSSKNT